MNEKLELLDEIDADIYNDDGFGWQFLIGVLLVGVIFLLLLFPKVYLQSKIYYKSREIAKLKRE